MTNCLDILRKSARKIRKMPEISGICEKFSFFISFFHSSPWKFVLGQVAKLLARGVVFELEFNPMLRDPASRRQWLMNAQSVVTLCRGKNLLLTSGARTSLEARSPYDLAQVARLVGVRAEPERLMMDGARAALEHAAARRGPRLLRALEPAPMES